jgi:RNA polymerase sigma-70 factor (ECF subfamily)
MYQGNSRTPRNSRSSILNALSAKSAPVTKSENVSNPAHSQDVTNGPAGASTIEGFSEEAVILSALTGNESAFEKLFHRYRDKILAICQRYSNGDRDQAHDLCQETFISAFRNLGRLRDRSRFFFWLAEIAKNKCISFIRSQRTLVKTLKEYQGIHHIMSDKEPQRAEAEIRLIEELIGKLENPDLKKTIRLFYIEGKKTAEIAEIQRITQTAVTTRLNRFRARFRKRMTEEILKRRGSER